MKYFTREWLSGELDDDEFEAAPRRYLEYLGGLGLTGDLARLASGIDLHDGLLEQVVIDREAASLILRFVAGDLRNGYCGVSIIYHGVIVEESMCSTLRVLASSTEHEMLQQEIERGEGGWWIHRMIFWRAEECEVKFRTIEVQESPRPSRVLATGVNHRYVERLQSAKI